jgi:hypothetical protein
MMPANGTDTPSYRCLAQALTTNQLHSERLMFKNWMRLTQDAMLLGLESQRVMGLRLMKLSRGGRAAQAMDPEKAMAMGARTPRVPIQR